MMKKTVLVVWIGLIIPVFNMTAGNNPESLKDNIRAYYNFESTTKPKYLAPNGKKWRYDQPRIRRKGTAVNYEVPFKYEPGHSGRGLRGSEKCLVGACDIKDGESGALSFWFKLDQGVDSSQNLLTTRVKAWTLIQLILNPDKKYLSFYSGIRVQKGDRQHRKPQVKINFDPTQWHHYTLVWSRPEKPGLGLVVKSIYVDGKLIAKHSEKALWPRCHGYYFSLDADGIYDDLIFWRNPLKPEFVMDLASGNYDSVLAGGELKTREPAFGVVYGKTTALDGIYEINTPIEMKIKTKLEAGAATAKKAELLVIDYFGKEYEPVAQKTLNGGENYLELKGVFHPQTLGSFKWKLVLRDGAGREIRAKDLVGFTVLSKAMLERKPSPDGFYGCHIDFNSYANDAKYAKRFVITAAKLGVDWCRSWCFLQFTDWRWVEPEKGKWVWHDDCADLLKSNGISVLGVLTTPPIWASRNPRKPRSQYIPPYVPRDFNEWKQYVYNISSHYSGKVNAWEIWNEPNVHPATWNGTAEEYYKLSKIAYDQVKKGSPEATVCGGGGMFFQKGTTFELMNRIFKLGALKYMDVLSLHTNSYINENYPLWLNENPLLKTDRLLAEYGKPGMNKWMTESFFAARGHLAKPDIEYPAQGVTPMWWRNEAAKTATQAISLLSYFSKYFLGVYSVQQKLGLSQAGFKPFPGNTTASQIDGNGKIVKQYLGNTNVRLSYYCPSSGTTALSVVDFMLEGKKFKKLLKSNNGVTALIFSDGKASGYVAALWYVNKKMTDAEASKQWMGDDYSGKTETATSVDITTPDNFHWYDIMGNKHTEKTVKLSIEPIYLKSDADMTEGGFIKAIDKIR